MSEALVHDQHLTGQQLRPSLELLPGGEQSLHGREIFDEYMQLRAEVLEKPKIEGEELASIQDSVNSWIDESGLFTELQDYSTYDKESIDKKLGGLTNYLRANFSTIPEDELKATELFVESAFALYSERTGNAEVNADADGTFAFIVPARMGRKHTNYGQEAEPAIPALRYVSNEMRAQFLVGVPPFVIDVYARNEEGNRGYLILAPVFEDMVEDNPNEALKLARMHANNAVDFAQERFGVESVGLGAVIPAFTNYGKAINNPNVNVTTGHGGTVHIIKEAMLKGVRDGVIDEESIKNIGTLGVGSIGSSIVKFMAESFPDSTIRIFDNEESKIKRTLKAFDAEGDKVIASESAADLIMKSSVVIAAVTNEVRLGDIDGLDLSNTLIIDDSQPGAFSGEEVKALGGSLTWPIAKDTRGLVDRNNYDYATMVDPHRDLFGCESEAASIALYSKELRERGMPDGARQRILAKVAIREAVTPQKVRIMGALFKKYGITASDYQAFGKLTTASHQ